VPAGMSAIQSPICSLTSLFKNNHQGSTRQQ
jgi:hypothetical protein